MNKLILIGNGFDLAHGLPTSYKDFIDDFWKNIYKNLEEDLFKKIIRIDRSISNFLPSYDIKNFHDFNKALINISVAQRVYYNSNEIFAKDKSKGIILLEPLNSFFKLINSKNSIENWVDIENEYYSELKKITKLTFGGFDEESTKAARKEKVLLLNKEFEQIKDLFEKYLFEKVVQKFDFKNPLDYNIFWQISEILKPIIVSKEPDFKNEVKKLSKEFSFSEDENEILTYENLLSKNNFERKVFQSLLLSFNYTPTVFEYINYINKRFQIGSCTFNLIHGQINSDKNKINFGFGDEMDDYYKEIENIGDNEYLKNFKSFQYSNTRNYHDLLGYIDSDKFQVHILGHSCGLSDRLLLNTIFEHENCRSIKIHYYKKEDSDNYTEIVQNISRHFKDKKLMRRKIVSKKLCSPLIQTVRFLRK